MFKKIFNAAKDLIRSPVGQIGIGLLVPGMAGMSGPLGGIGRFAAANPMVTQAGIGLLAGDKPENVLRNVAYGTALGGISNLGQPGGFMGGAQQALGMQPKQIAPAVQNLQTSSGGYLGENTDFNPVKFTQQVKQDPSFLERFGLVNTGEGLDFFEKYSPLLKLGSIGASIAAAALGEDQAQSLYDPNQNPYLTGDTKITDVYTPLEYKKGGILDFPEKDGMINGPGNGQSDDIPAMLSDGEFVMTKQAVMAAGNGDRNEGTKKMYSMMNSLENKADNMGIGRM